MADISSPEAELASGAVYGLSDKESGTLIGRPKMILKTIEPAPDSSKAQVASVEHGRT
jgi:hypothetical protein